jgi:hypothetical protein
MGAMAWNKSLGPEITGSYAMVKGLSINWLYGSFSVRA